MANIGKQEGEYNLMADLCLTATHGNLMDLTFFGRLLVLVIIPDVQTSIVLLVLDFITMWMDVEKVKFEKGRCLQIVRTLS